MRKKPITGDVPVTDWTGRNVIKCKRCGDIIESKSVHDFRTCSCKAVSIDGGADYQRVCGTDWLRYDEENLTWAEPNLGAVAEVAVEEAKPLHRLCYIEDGFAYFTNIPPNKQNGDGWDDDPYYCNAGEPYEDFPGQIHIMAFISGALLPPKDRGMKGYSVNDINARQVPWLSSDLAQDGVSVSVWAGCTEDEFERAVHQCGGRVFKQVPIPERW